MRYDYPPPLGSRVKTEFMPIGTIVKIIDPSIDCKWKEHPELLPIDRYYYVVAPDNITLKPHIVRHDELGRGQPARNS